MDISSERFTELVVQEHKYQRLCTVIQDRVRAWLPLDVRELQLIVDLFCPIQKEDETEGSDDFPCL